MTVSARSRAKISMTRRACRFCSNSGEMVCSICRSADALTFASALGPLDPNADAKVNASALRQMLHTISPEFEQNLQALRVMEIFARERALTVMPFRLIIK